MKVEVEMGMSEGERREMKLFYNYIIHGIAIIWVALMYVCDFL
jgi:hypothetical protein